MPGLQTVKQTLSLPKELMTTVKRRVRKGRVSHFVAEAVREKLESEEREKLREELRVAYSARAPLHRKLAAEFFEAEEEASESLSVHGEDQREDRA